MDGALQAIKNVCSGRGDTIDPVLAHIKELLGDHVVSNTYYGRHYMFFNHDTNGWKDKAAVGERGNSILILTDSSRSAAVRCNERYFLEDLIAILLVYNHLKANPESKVDSEKLLRCLCRELYGRQPLSLEESLFFVYYFPDSSDRYYICCRARHLDVLFYNDIKDLVLVDTDEGYIILIDHNYVTQAMLPQLQEEAGLDPEFQQALYEFEKGTA
jgi:hypothetical protein